MSAYLIYLVYNSIVFFIYTISALYLLIKQRKTLEYPAKIVISLYFLCDLLRVSYLAVDYDL